MTPEEQAHFRLLKALERNPQSSQRELAEAIGLSLGRTNYVLHALMEKGFLKVGRFLQANNKLTKTAYLLTAAGIRHRLELTQDYVARKQQEYEALKLELENLKRENPHAFVTANSPTPGQAASGLSRELASHTELPQNCAAQDAPDRH